MDIHRRKWTWLIQVMYLARSNALKTLQSHRKKVLNLPSPKTVYLGNKLINIIHRMGLVTCLHSNHWQVLHCFMSTFQSTRHTVRNQPPVQAKEIQVFDHSGKDMTSTKIVMVGRKCFPLHRLQDKGCHFQVDWECLQNHRNTTQQMVQHLPPLILYLNHSPAHLWDP